MWHLYFVDKLKLATFEVNFTSSCSRVMVYHIRHSQVQIQPTSQTRYGGSSCENINFLINVHYTH